MPHFFGTIQALASQNHFLAYFIIYLTVIFFGNVAVFAFLWLVVKGLLGRWGLPFFLLATFAADVSADILWYWLGRTLRETRFGGFIRKLIPRHNKIQEHLHQNSPKWIFLAKFMHSSNFPIIFMVGWTKIRFKKFFKTALVAILAWLLVLLVLSIGLIAGFRSLETYKIIRFEKLFLIGIIVFFAASFLIKEVLRRAFGENYTEKIVAFLNKEM